MISPDYDPNTWKLGYQAAQFGACGPNKAEVSSIYYALANPSQSMTDAFDAVITHPHYEPNDS